MAAQAQNMLPAALPLHSQPPYPRLQAPSGGESSGAGGGVSRPQSVAQYSQHHVAGGRGVANTGAGAGQGGLRKLTIRALRSGKADRGESRTTDGASVAFADARRSIGLHGATTPGSASPALFHGE